MASRFLSTFSVKKVFSAVLGLFSFSQFFIFVFLKIVFLVFFLNICSFKHLYWCLAKDVSSVVGGPWRCGVLTTQGGIVGIGFGHQLDREHDSTP